jgi:glycosyltransferase involved in cell wall biosynthesis
MVIGVDASRAFIDQPTGTERYAFEVITEMLKLPEARKHTWVLYVKPNNFQSSIYNLQSILKNKNFQLKIQSIGLPYLWTQLGLAARTWVDGLDILWIPAHTLPVLRKPGIKTVVTIHGIEYEWLPAFENRLQRWYLPLSTKYAVRSASKIISVSEFTKNQLVARLGADGKKIKVIHEGYDSNSQFSIINCQSIQKSSIFRKYNIQPRKYILFVGTVQPRKNLERLIEAFSYLTPESSPKLGGGNKKGGVLKLVIAGKLGWSYTGVLEAPAKWGVKERVLFCGYVNDYTRRVLLKSCLVYVQSSITEGFGIPVLEAMAAGIPVVSSGGGALAEVVGDAGLLFDPFNTKDIFRKLSGVIKSKKLQKSLVEKGRQRVKMYGWKQTASKTLKLIVC